jgi:hypothetical protein
MTDASMIECLAEYLRESIDGVQITTNVLHIFIRNESILVQIGFECDRRSLGFHRFALCERGYYPMAFVGARVLELADPNLQDLLVQRAKALISIDSSKDLLMVLNQRGATI